MDEDKEKLLPKGETSFTENLNQKLYGSFAVRIPDTIDEDVGSLRSREFSNSVSASASVGVSGALSTEAGSFSTAVGAPAFPQGRQNGGLPDLGDSGQESPFLATNEESFRPPALNVVGLSYEVKERPGQWWNGSCFRKPRKLQILRNLCMTFRSGELTALVGNSGSGKTSLLDIISGRAQGQVSGVVSYKHETCTRDVMKQRSSYVLQADRLLPTLTVRETLTYMAYLKLPGHWNADQIDEKVQSVILDMGLRDVADSRIGGAVIRGVSGGEKRRITIGVQLLKNPEILLLDEPTSGLDAFTARHLVSSLADLAHRGKLVLMSIHQPRSDIFGLLDKIAILTVGRVAFSGRPSQMVPYFSKIGYPCPREQNPCDVYIDVTSVDRRTPAREKETFAAAQKICNAFSNSDLQANIIKEITSGLNHHYNESLEFDGKSGTSSPSWGRIFRNLLIRMNVHLQRDRGSFIGRLAHLPFFVPFILIFVGRLGTNEGSIQDRLGVVYQAVQTPPYMGLLHAVAMFPPLRDVFYRECSDGLYSTTTFLSAYFFHVLPYNIGASALFSILIYWIVGLNEDVWVFFQFFIMCIILMQFGEIMAIAFLGIFRDSQLANNTTSLVLAASGLLASGLLRSIENMPDILQWAGYIAVHKYATEVIVVNEFKGLVFDCESSVPGEPCQTTGQDFIDQVYPGAENRLDRNWGLVCSYFVAILILAVMLFKARGIPILH
ncbi:ATP-binding cassette sub-family G member 5 [Aplysia californica]|uniref:ATP-binding cassette sub-family G member 5 n=1 Tax=Aplysia californica TaxID=6500 RepID=A0ABM1A3Q6_APLCA|nr:ATP-binding cassette sub-family G member 5 [Aplysia californica]